MSRYEQLISVCFTVNLHFRLDCNFGLIKSRLMYLFQHGGIQLVCVILLKVSVLTEKDGLQSKNLKIPLSPIGTDSRQDQVLVSSDSFLAFLLLFSTAMSTLALYWRLSNGYQARVTTAQCWGFLATITAETCFLKSHQNQVKKKKS